jgi:anti-anti-sigma factor
MSTQIQTSQQDGVTVVRIRGELTQLGAPTIQREFLTAVDAQFGGVVVDLSGVHLITTPGITLLVSVNERLSEQGRKLVFAGLKGSVAEVLLERCRLDLVLTVAPNVDTAVRAANQA